MEKIKIDWEFPPERTSSKAWHKWNDEPLFSAQDTDKKIEASLALPSGTIDVLRRAFSLGLPRNQGWDLQNIPHTQSQRYQQAAAIYKRGVPVSQHAQAPSLKKGHYKITIHHYKACFEPPLDDNSFIIIDTTLFSAWPHLENYGDFFAEDLSEHEKSLTLAAQIAEQWRQKGHPKQWIIVGGGLLSDVASFCASLLGCSFRFIPTTLLAMVDACVGGKTGVNFPPYGKNQIGLFAFPDAVDIYPSWLKTLPERELLAGGGECLKHSILSRDRLLAEKIAKALSTKDTAQLAKFLRPLIEIKSRIVASDPDEQGLRRTLNLGHTLAHALEGLSQHNSKSGNLIHHGEAVTLGLLFCAIVSNYEGYLSDKGCDEIFTLLDKSGCLISAYKLEKYLGSKLNSPSIFQNILSLIAHDKKQRGGPLEWVLLRKFGEIANPDNGFLTQVQAHALEAAWKEFTIAISPGKSVD